MAGGGSFTPNDLKILLVGPRGAGKTYVANKIIGAETSEEITGLCIKKKGIWKGQPVTVVDIRGWDSVSVKQTHFPSDQILEGAALCLPGPNVVILVLPISTNEVPSNEEIQTACQHIELLSEKAWNYTIVLFVCKQKVEQSVIDRHVKATKKLLEKCDQRHFILQNDPQVANLQQEIEDLVGKNCRDCLSYSRDILHSLSSGAKSHGTAELNRQAEELQQTVKHPEMKRRNSAEQSPPSMEKTGNKEVLVQAQRDITPLVQYGPWLVMIFAFIGALLGAVAGASTGVAGSVQGILLGSLGGIVVSLMIFGAAKFVDSKTPHGGEKSTNTKGVGLTEKAKKQ